jgi:PEP-CTERM motif
MYRERPVQWFGGAVAMAAAMVLPIPVQASAITAIDEFVITRSSITGSLLGTYESQQVFYRDSFNDGTPPPSAGSFFNGNTGTYNIIGSFPAGTELGGKLGLDSSLGGAFITAGGGSRTLQRSVLITDINPSSEAGLKQAFHTFSVFGLFDLTIPPVGGDGYGIAVNDGGPLGATESIDLFVRREMNDDLVIRFQEQDFLNSVGTTLELDSLVIPTGADQIELQLQRADLETGALTASYRFWDDGTAMSPSFTTMSATADFFTNNGWARGVFFAVEAVKAVPEPSTLPLVLLGGVGLAAATRPRRRVGTA